MKMIALLTMIAALHLAAPSFAQEPESQKVEIFTADVSAEELTRLVHDAEEASEGSGETKSKNKIVNFAKEYATKMNIPRVALGMYRWYNVMEGKYPSIAADLSIMLLASHTTEMLSGPIGVTMAASSGAPEWVQWAIGVTGGVISIPGLDPLCIALGVAYVKSPKFRKGVTQTRVFVVKAANQMGADRFFNWFVQKQSRVDFIRNALEQQPGKYTYLLNASDGEPGLAYDFKNKDGEVFARVDFERNPESDQVFASQISFQPDALSKLSTREFSSMLSLFNSNVRIALNQAFKAMKTHRLESLSGQYHVASVAESSVQFRPNALKLTDKITCNRFLGGRR